MSQMKPASTALVVDSPDDIVRRSSVPRYGVALSLKLADVRLWCVARRKELEAIILTDTAINDAVIVHINGMTNLATLFFRGSDVTDELETALSDCCITGMTSSVI